MFSLPLRSCVTTCLLLLPCLARTETLEAWLAPVVAAEIKRIAALPPPDEPWERDSFIVYASQDALSNPEVIVTGQGFLANNAADTQIIEQRASAWRQLGQFTLALDELQRVPAADANDPGVLLVRAHILRQQGRLPGALAAAQAGAQGDTYRHENCANFVRELAAIRPLWEKSIRPILAKPPANPDPALARAALDCGADNLAHDLATRVLATHPSDPIAREVLLTLYHKLDLDTPALTTAVHAAAAPLAAAHARAHPTAENVWRTAVLYASSLLTDAPPSAVAAFRTLLNDAAANGADLPREQIRLQILEAPDAAVLNRLSAEHYGQLSNDDELQVLIRHRLQATSPVRPLHLAAQAESGSKQHWETLLAAARTEIEAARLPGAVYGTFVEQAIAAGHAFPAEKHRATLYAADNNYGVIQAIRTVLPATRDYPDLEATITAVSRRITDIAPASLGFTANLIPEGTKPLFDEETYFTPASREATLKIMAGLPRALAWFEQGAPGFALAEWDATPPDLRNTPLGWLLRAQLLLDLGRPQEGLLALDRALFLAGKPFDLAADEKINRFHPARLRDALLTACQIASREIVPLQEKLIAAPDDAAQWGWLALRWSEPPLRCVPKALLAAARARALEPRQPAALLAERNCYSHLLAVVPGPAAKILATQLLERLPEFTNNDWVLRAQMLRHLPAETRKPLAAEWNWEVRLKRDRIQDADLLAKVFAFYGLKTHVEVEDWLAAVGEVPADHPLHSDFRTAQLVDQSYCRRRGWFIGEPHALLDDEWTDDFEETLEGRNLTAEDQLKNMLAAHQAADAADNPNRLADRAAFYARVWPVYESLRLRSLDLLEPPPGSALDHATHRQRVITTGQYGPAEATDEPDVRCLPYFPGLTSAERKLATECIRLLLTHYIDKHQARLANTTFVLFQRQETREREVAAMVKQLNQTAGWGDLQQYPELQQVTDLLQAQRYDEAAAKLQPLLDRGVTNFYVTYYAGMIAHQAQRHTESLRLYHQAREMVAAVPALTSLVDANIQIVRNNASAQRAYRRAQIESRIKQLREYLAYLERDGAHAVAMANSAAANMQRLNDSAGSMTIYNADSMQRQADSLSSTHAGSKSHLQNLIQTAKETEAEIEELQQELRRL